MSLRPKISTSELKNSFVVYDCTGKFSSSNQGGYDSQNPKIKDVEDACLNIFTPSNPYSQDATPFKIVVYPDLPNDKGFGFEVMPEMIGQKDSVESGKYTIEYVVSGKDKNGISYTRKSTHVCVFVNSVICCIDKRGKHVDKNAFKDEKQKKTLELDNILQSVLYQIECELFDAASENIEYLKAQCECCGC